MKLNKLHISSFRGATQPVDIPFEKGKKITMIYAENGNGKSTIADALICLFTNEKGSIGDKSGTDSKFIKSLNATEASIALDTDKGVYTAKLSGTAREFVKSIHEYVPDLRYLRRSQIIDLLNLKASERYERLKNYIDVSGLYKSEEELRKLLRDTDSEVENLVSVIENSKSTLESIWLKEESPMGDMFVWAKAESEKDLTKEGAQLRELQILSQQWTAIQTKYTEIQQSITIVGAAKKSHTAALEALQKLQEKNTTNNADLLNLLTQAKNFIEGQPTIDTCPVCDNGIEKNSVVKSLSDKIASMSAIGIAAKAVEKAKKDWDAKVAIQKRAVELFSNLLIKYQNAIAKYKASVPEIATFIDGITTDKVENYKCYQNNLTQLNNLSERIEKAKEKYSKTINHYNSIKEQYNSIIENSKKFEHKSKLSVAATKALEIVEKSRKEFYDNELLSISGDVERMYQQLHPDEGLGGIKMFLNPQYKTSLELQANFHTEEGIAPQSVYSESHLDTLGICIFLALAKKYSKGDTILVLDDVVMSVDQNHLDRFIDLIHNEAAHFSQIIITTHYGPWRDRYRNNRAPSGDMLFLELRKWSKENGIRVKNSKIALDELKEMLEDEDKFHRENISSASGRILENMLDYLTFLFSSKLPRKPKGDYQLHELLTGLSSQLVKLLKVEHLEKDEQGKYTKINTTVELQTIIEKLKQLKAVRNQVGAHFNFDGSLVSDDDVADFGNATVEFAKLIICPEAGSLPDRNPSGSYWETRTGSIRLYPLIDPKS